MKWVEVNNCQSVDIDKMKKVWVGQNGGVWIRDDQGEAKECACGSVEEARKAYRNVMNQLTKRRSPMETIKGYFKKHEETCMTLAIIILVDHFIFNGSFRQKIKDLVDGLLTKTSKKLLEDEANENPK